MAKIPMILRYIFTFCFLVTTIVGTGLVVNLIQCILYLTLHPYNKYLYRKINYYLSYTLYSQMIFIAEWYSGSETCVYVDKNDLEKYFGKEHACVIMNHRYEVDWLFIGTFAEKVHVAGNFKAYMKKIIQYIPAIGWCLFFSENVFLERSFDKDKEVILKQIREIMDFPDPMWLVLFPEGTRFNSEKHEESLQLAKNKGLPQLKYHLMPRPKGFLTSLPPMKDKLKAIYDVTLSIKEDEVEPTMLNVILGQKLSAHFYIRRIPFEQVPKDEEKATQFLNDIFSQKDKLQESFFTTGDYFVTSGVKRIDPIKLKPSFSTLINAVMWQIIIMVPLIYYLLKTLLSADIITLSMIIIALSGYKYRDME